MLQGVVIAITTAAWGGFLSLLHFESKLGHGEPYMHADPDGPGGSKTAPEINPLMA